jgi:hypothetical protein
MKPSMQYLFNYWGVKQLQQDTATGGALPPADEALLRQVWTVFPAEKGQGQSADAWSVFDRVGPVAFVRAAALNELWSCGELAPWQRGGRDLEDFVFREAASFAFSNNRQHKEFLQYLQDTHPTK